MFDVANIRRISESSKFSENYLSHIEVRVFSQKIWMIE